MHSPRGQAVKAWQFDLSKEGHNTVLCIDRGRTPQHASVQGLELGQAIQSKHKHHAA